MNNKSTYQAKFSNGYTESITTAREINFAGYVSVAGVEFAVFSKGNSPTGQCPEHKVTEVVSVTKGA